MNFVGIDLHKKTISICIVDQNRQVVNRKQLACAAPDAITTYLTAYQPFRAVVEATASYLWLVTLLDPIADGVVLAHPQKMRLIAESTRKSDKLDAQVLAEFLALDMIPQAYRPTEREREHRQLVRQRVHLQNQIKRTRTKIRALLADHNADRPDLFTPAGLEYLATVRLPKATRFVVNQLKEEWDAHRAQCRALHQELRRFAKAAQPREREARAVLDSFPCVGPVTTEVVLSEMGALSRFRAQKQACAYAGLAPGQRSSAGHTREMGITKQGSSLLRWVLVELAWRVTRQQAYWSGIYAKLAKRRGRKRAIVAVARRLLCVMVSMLQSGRRYQPAAL